MELQLGKGTFSELVYLNLSGTQINNLDFLEQLPELRQLDIRVTNIGLEQDENSNYCSEFAKIDLYCSELLGLNTSSAYVDILDIDGYVCRAISGLKYIPYCQFNKSGSSYIVNYWPVSLTNQLGRLGVNFPASFRVIGPTWPSTGYVDLSSCTNLTSVTLDSGQRVKLPGSVKTISSSQGASYIDLSLCSGVAFDDFRPGTANSTVIADSLKIIYDNDVSISSLGVSLPVGVSYNIR